LFDDNNIIQFNPRATYVHKNDQKHKIDIGAEKLLQILLETFNLNSLEQLAKLYHIFNLEQFTKNLRNESLITSTYHGEVNRHTSLKKTMFLIKNENVSNKFVDALAKICTINNNNPIV
jgi:hypothetical protein